MNAGLGVEGCAYRVDGDLHFVHLWVAHFVVRRIDQDLIEDLVQPRDILNVLEHQLLPIVHPQLLLLLLSAACKENPALNKKAYILLVITACRCP